MPTSRTPMRRCVACGARRPQAELVRLQRRLDRTLAVTGEARRCGRGAYCCPADECLRRMTAKRLWSRSLKAATVVESEEQLFQDLQRLAANLKRKTG